MLLERLYDEMLAQASYLIGCERSGQAIVVDPTRDVDSYLELAARKHLRIAYVTETHIHADFVSGARELAERTGAALFLSAHGEGEWAYRTSGQLVHDGDRIDVGDVSLAVRHTPGHTPEHVAFVVTDRAVSDRPLGLLSGDFIFVGDVGRPDLLERAANARGSADTLARQLFRSVRAAESLPDFLQIWPGHGAGSACGKSLGALPSTTVGYERLANWAFQVRDEDTFVREALGGQAPPPPYFARMKVVNRDGPPPRASRPIPTLGLREFRTAVENGALAVDVRGSAAFAAGHIPRTLNLPLGSSFLTWAGWLLPYDRDLVLLGDDADRVARARNALSLIGIDRVIASADGELRSAWAASTEPLGKVEQIDVTSLATSNHRTIVDVRNDAEWSAGHLPGAQHLFLGDLAARAGEMAPDAPIALHCGGGTRSSIAASLLLARGFTNVFNATGGYGAWTAAGLPVVRDDGEKR
ncbi:MAG TPA: MBL fold metallo-hydrolase [Gemmatimonadaceae bacterium]|nr:MBL fold metallo-hydrolase [Gemmatimonadaceae bacterium]